MKLKTYTLLLAAMFVDSATTAVAQTRDKVLNVTVTDETGESLAGQKVNVMQTDYQVSYTPATLDADGKCSMKIYAGNHSLSITRDGYNPLSATFSVAEDERGKDLTLKLMEKTRDPFALNAATDFDPYTGAARVSLSWNVEKPAFYDDFESYSPFAVTFGDWTGIDGDHLVAAPLTGDYANRGVMQYAQIMNPLAVEPMWYYDYPVLRAYGGKQYVGFVRTQSGEANDDWLISPEITVGTDNILSFYAKAADKYDEKFIVYITTNCGSPQPDDFTPLTTGNYESVDYKKWHNMQYDLSEYAGKHVKIAIRYIGAANYGGAFMLMVDDFYVGQPSYGDAASPANAPRAVKSIVSRRVAKSPANPNEVFHVYADGTEVGTTDTYSYVLTDVPVGVHEYGVKAKYLAAESSLTTATVDVNTRDYAALTINVGADSKLPADGTTVNVLSEADGKLYTPKVADGKIVFKLLPKGKYVVSVEKGAFKELSKEIDLQADATENIVLEDEAMTPFNITADVTGAADGTSTAVVRWNQILGFSDSFESYPDFATGEFGGWKSYDLDKMPVYPIGLGSTDNIVSFPGSGTASNPTAIAPIVFNPWTTNPAMLPTDNAMLAPDGNKYVVFFSPQRAQADKWLISPLVSVYDNYELKVTGKSYDPVYLESLEFAVSDGSDNPSDFKTISTATQMPNSQWTEYTTSLADYAGKKVRIGIHYVSYDTFFAQVDNVKVGPAEGSETNIDYGNIVKFNVYLDGNLVGSTATTDFTVTGLSEGNHTIGIEAVYKNSTSAMGTYDIVVTGIEAIRGETIPARSEIFNLEGQKMHGTIGSLPRGVYVVKEGNTVRKIRK